MPFHTAASSLGLPKFVYVIFFACFCSFLLLDLYFLFYNMLGSSFSDLMCPIICSSRVIENKRDSFNVEMLIFENLGRDSWERDLF